MECIWRVWRSSAAVWYIVVWDQLDYYVLHLYYYSAVLQTSSTFMHIPMVIAFTATRFTCFVPGIFAGNRMHEMNLAQTQIVKDCVYEAIRNSQDREDPGCPWVYSLGMHTSFRMRPQLEREIWRQTAPVPNLSFRGPMGGLRHSTLAGDWTCFEKGAGPTDSAIVAIHPFPLIWNTTQKAWFSKYGLVGHL